MSVAEMSEHLLAYINLSSKKKMFSKQRICLLTGPIRSDSERCNMQKESFEHGVLPFLSLLIYSNAYKLY